MTNANTNTTEDQLTLRSEMSQLALLTGWVEGLAARHGVPERTRFAMELCLEESVSNVIRHGYAGRTDRPVVVRFVSPRKGAFVLFVEDEAPRFNPLDVMEPPAYDGHNKTQVGGQGIRLMREFADEVSYEEAAPTGNRLRMVFSGDESSENI